MSHAITVEGLSKSYLLKHRRKEGAAYRTLREALAESPGKLLRMLREGTARSAETEEVFWALRDVGFNVNEGERLAIIGSNGAGKSTLLKLLSRITEPSTGSIRIRGRLSSLLEVGTGFHPELTGRENIYLSGAVLGMSRGEIRRKFDAIVDFSEVEAFLDTPVKRYSSGMYVKLAFSVAAFLDPDIIVLDEVLSVGDAAFQRKSQQKMLELAGQGRTVIFVSHSMAAVRSICDSGIVLQAGRASEKMPVAQAVSAYLALSDHHEGLSFPYVTDEVVINGLRLIQHGDVASEFQGGDEIDVEIDFNVLSNLKDFRIGFYINTVFGERLVRCLLADWRDDNLGNVQQGRFIAQGRIPANFLVEGRFTFELHCSRFGVRDYFGSQISIPITVRRAERYNSLYPGEEPFGHVHLNADWHLEGA
jgi:lipopolysaccharide transport system ATP-binding protein